MKYLSIRINLFINPISNSTIARGFSSYKNEDNKKEERWDEGRNNVERSLPSGCRVAQLKFSVKFLIYPETLAGGHPRGRATNGISPSNFFPGETAKKRLEPSNDKETQFRPFFSRYCGCVGRFPARDSADHRHQPMKR